MYSILAVPKKTKYYRFPQIYHKLNNLLNMAPNLPELPINNESKFKETVKHNLQFLKSLVYLTKKIFML